MNNKETIKIPIVNIYLGPLLLSIYDLLLRLLSFSYDSVFKVVP